MLIVIISICRLQSLVGVVKHEAVNLVRSNFQQSKLKFGILTQLVDRDWMARFNADFDFLK